MSDFKDFIEGNGLWANIHKKRKEGRPMRKAGSKGAPTKQDFKRARSEDLEEAPLVMNDMDMVKTLFNKISSDMSKNIRSKRPEKNWPVLQQLAKIAGYGITKSGQDKNKTFRYDLKK